MAFQKLRGLFETKIIDRPFSYLDQFSNPG